MTALYSVANNSVIMPVTTDEKAADNECAEALLQLAMSTSPLVRSDMRRPSSSSQGSLSPKSKHSRTYSTTSLSSYKRCQSTSWTSPEYGSGFTEDQENEIQSSLVKRIRLDHNYCWSGDENFRPADYPVFQNGASDSLLEEILGDDVGIPPRWNKENALMSPSKAGPKKSPGRRTRPYYGSCPRKKYATGNSHSNKVTYSEEQKASASTNSNITSSRDKYSKFQLLMKCLMAEDPKVENVDLSSTNRDRQHRIEVATVNKTNVESEDDESDSGPFIDMESDEGDAHYVCPECPKTFSKRRYLTKHVRRMHPETDFPDTKDEIATACPNCFRVIQKRNFRRHLMVCDVEMSRSRNKHYTDSDLAFCQFCGVQMKRHLLVKHLAKEHCIDRHTIQFDQEFSKFLADDENASMYPSDTSYPMHETSGTYSAVQTVEVQKTKDLDVAALIIPCPKCGVSISDDLLARHMALDHDILMDSTSVLATARKCSCKHSMLQAYLDGTTQTSAASSATGSSYPCEACVQNLSTLSEHCSATVSARSSERIALSSPVSCMSSTSPVKSTRGSSSTISAEETRIQVSLMEDTALTLLKCASTPIDTMTN